MTARTGVKKAYHHGNLRESILTAALELIARDGVEALTLREIADRVGVSRMAPYRHFADKAALVCALSELGFRRFGDALEEALAAAGHDFRKRMKALGFAYLRFAKEHPAHYEVMFGRGAGAPQGFGPEWAAAAERAFEILRRTVAEGQEKGHVRAGDSANLARIVWAQTHGLASLQLIEDLADGSPGRKLFDLATDSLLRGLRG